MQVGIHYTEMHFNDKSQDLISVYAKVGFIVYLNVAVHLKSPLSLDDVAQTALFLAAFASIRSAPRFNIFKD